MIAISALAVATIITLRMGQYPSVCTRPNLPRLQCAAETRGKEFSGMPTVS